MNIKSEDFRPTAAEWQELYAHAERSKSSEKALYRYASGFVPQGKRQEFYGGMVPALRWMIVLTTMGLKKQEDSDDVTKMLGAVMYAATGLHRLTTFAQSNVSQQIDPDCDFQPDTAFWLELHDQAQALGAENELKKHVSSYLPSMQGESPHQALEFFQGYVTALRYGRAVLETWIGQDADASATIANVDVMMYTASEARMPAFLDSLPVGGSKIQ